MNVKALTFAGLGVMAAMIPTAMWIQSDMAAIEAKRKAKLQVECSQRGPQASGLPAGSSADPLAKSTPPPSLLESERATQVDPCTGLAPMGSANTPPPTNVPPGDVNAAADQAYAGESAPPPAQEYPQQDMSTPPITDGQDPYASADMGTLPSVPDAPPVEVLPG